MSKEVILFTNQFILNNQACEALYQAIEDRKIPGVFVVQDPAKPTPSGFDLVWVETPFGISEDDFGPIAGQVKEAFVEAGIVDEIRIEKITIEEAEHDYHNRIRRSRGRRISSGFSL